MMTTTVARLRDVLAPTFPETATVLRRFREAGLIAAGSGGRDGRGSAPITPHQAVLALLALASGVAPIEAPTAALALAEYRLRAVYVPDGGGLFVRDDIDHDLCFVKWAIEVLHRAANPDFRLVSWIIKLRHSILAIDAAAEWPRLRLVPAAAPPDRADAVDPCQKFFLRAGDIRPGSQDFREARTPGLWFEPAAPSAEESWHSFAVKPGLIGAVAGLFVPAAGATVILSGIGLRSPLDREEL